MKIPRYLKNYESLYMKNPREANKKWFKDAKYGLFIHYGLYSLLEKHEWIQDKEKIYAAEYGKLKDSFTAEKFDADHIVSFAVECGMKYICLTTRHHESFCLWDTKETSFNSVNSPAKRDLVGELMAACENHGLGLFLYYSHGRDWKHPHAPNNDEWGGLARPVYAPPEPSYAYGQEHNLNIYLDFMNNQIAELLTSYPQAAGIWLDGVSVPLNGPTEKFKIPEFYEHIRRLSPHALIAYKQGVTGEEDYFTPEHYIPSEKDDEKKAGQIGKFQKLIEVNTTMIKEPISWGYCKGAVHKTCEEVVGMVEGAFKADYNLLLNTGPLPDGSLDPEDEKVLREAGRILKEKGVLKE